MGDIVVDTDPVPVLKGPEITSEETTGLKPVEPMASNGSGEGHRSEACCPYSLTHDQQVHNLKENWKRAFPWTDVRINFGDESETNLWFPKVVSQLRADPCLESYENKIEQPLIGDLVSGLTSLDLAILMRDPMMVHEIFERSSDPNNLVRGSLVDREKALDHFKCIGFNTPKKTGFLYTPLHLAVVSGNNDIIDALLEKGADVNAPNWLGETPLQLAGKLGSWEVLLQLLRTDEDKGKDLRLHGEINGVKRKKKTLLHYLATIEPHKLDLTNIIQSLVQINTLDIRAVDESGLSAFYVAVLCCNTEFVIALLEFFKDRIRLNEVCDKDLGSPIQIAFEGGEYFKAIERVLMECEPVRGYLEKFYNDRQVYLDAANAILIGASVIASVTFSSWLQPPLNYTSYSPEGYSSANPAPSTSDLNYVDVEHNIALRAFWVFNALSFYFAIGTIVYGAYSVIPRCHLFIEKAVEKIRINLLVTSILLACSVFFVIIAFAIAGTIVLTPLVKYRWCMIVPTIVGGMVCIISLGFLVRSMRKNYSNTRVVGDGLNRKGRKYLRNRGYCVSSTRFGLEA